MEWRVLMNLFKIIVEIYCSVFRGKWLEARQVKVFGDILDWSTLFNGQRLALLLSADYSTDDNRI
jgi:hypothetical protein